MSEIFGIKYIDLNQMDKVSEVLANIKLTQPRERWHSLLLFAAKDMLVDGKDGEAGKLLKQLIASLLENKNTLTAAERKLLAFAYYYDGQYSEAKSRLTAIVGEGGSPEEYTYLAISAKKTNADSEARSFLRKLEGLRGPYQYGSIDYGLAQYYAANNELQQAINYLMEAVADGKRFNPATYQHDVHFKPLFKTESFQKVLDYWK